MKRQGQNSTAFRVQSALCTAFCLLLSQSASAQQQRQTSYQQAPQQEIRTTDHPQQQRPTSFQQTQAQQARTTDHPQQRSQPQVQQQGQHREANGYGRPGLQQGNPNNRQPTRPLSDWFMRHQNLSVPEQQKALQREPGFNQLQPEMQTRLLDRLNKLNGMPVDQRQRFLLRAEAMESLPPQKKQQVAQSGAQLREMPADRQALVRKAFQDLRAIPPDQRDAVLNSQRFAGVFNPHERVVLSNLLSIEPYTPPRGFHGADDGPIPAGR